MYIDNVHPTHPCFRNETFVYIISACYTIGLPFLFADVYSDRGRFLRNYPEPRFDSTTAQKR